MIREIIDLIELVSPEPEEIIRETVGRKQLQKKEVVLIPETSVSYQDGAEKATENYAATLTNQKLIITVMGMWGKKKGVITYPIRGSSGGKKILAAVEKDRTTLGVSTDGSYFEIGFSSKKEMKKWKEWIQNLLRSEQFLEDQEDDSLLGSAVRSRTDMQGAESSAEKVPKATEYAVGRCPYCGAPLSGKRGYLVVCEYCDQKAIID